MYPLLRPSVESCPQCGCADIEHMGRHGGNYRYMCIEGHKFEVPKPPGVLARWRQPEKGPKSKPTRNKN